MSEYLISLFIPILIYTLLAQSFAFSFGFGGLINLAHISSYAIGAYVASLLMLEAKFGFFSAAFIAGVTAALLGYPVSFLAARLKEDFFVIGTLTFATLVSTTLINWSSVTRGVLGISGIPRPQLGGIDFFDNCYFLALLFLCTALAGGILFLLFKSPWGRALRAQAENEQALRLLGRNDGTLRLYSLLLSAFICGVSGAFFASYMGFIDPSSFQLQEMVLLLSIVMLGGLRSWSGILFATGALLLIPEALRFSAELSTLLRPDGAGYQDWSFMQLLLTAFADLLSILSQPAVLGPTRQILYAIILLFMLYLRRKQVSLSQRIF